jgi:hypothetical protein
MQQFMVPTVSQILVKYGSISIILFIQILWAQNLKQLHIALIFFDKYIRSKYVFTLGYD